jgi:hypothetical protein
MATNASKSRFVLRHYVQGTSLRALKMAWGEKFNNDSIRQASYSNCIRTVQMTVQPVCVCAERRAPTLPRSQSTVGWSSDWRISIVFRFGLRCTTSFVSYAVLQPFQRSWPFMSLPASLHMVGVYHPTHIISRKHETSCKISKSFEHLIQQNISAEYSRSWFSVMNQHRIEIFPPFRISFRHYFSVEPED